MPMRNIGGCCCEPCEPAEELCIAVAVCGVDAEGTITIDDGDPVPSSGFVCVPHPGPGHHTIAYEPTDGFNAKPRSIEINLTGCEPESVQINTTRAWTRYSTQIIAPCWAPGCGTDWVITSDLGGAGTFDDTGYATIDVPNPDSGETTPIFDVAPTRPTHVKVSQSATAIGPCTTTGTASVTFVLSTDYECCLSNAFVPRATKKTLIWTDPSGATVNVTFGAYTTFDAPASRDSSCSAASTTTSIRLGVFCYNAVTGYKISIERRIHTCFSGGVHHLANGTPPSVTQIDYPLVVKDVPECGELDEVDVVFSRSWGIGTPGTGTDGTGYLSEA